MGEAGDVEGRIVMAEQVVHKKEEDNLASLRRGEYESQGKRFPAIAVVVAEGIGYKSGWEDVLVMLLLLILILLLCHLLFIDLGSCSGRLSLISSRSTSSIFSSSTTVCSCRSTYSNM